MTQVETWRSERPYIVTVRPHPIFEDRWVLQLPSGATLTAPMTLDDDGEPMFSFPRRELLAYVALADELNFAEMDMRLSPDGGLEVDLGNVVKDSH